MDHARGNRGCKALAQQQQTQADFFSRLPQCPVHHVSEQLDRVGTHIRYVLEHRTVCGGDEMTNIWLGPGLVGYCSVLRRCRAR